MLALQMGTALPMGADNLLENPGFELLDGSRPVQWDVFVQPQEGAVGVVDDSVAFEGDYSVRLHNPEPYETEPCNNWSQNLLMPLAESELRVRGYVKTRDAGGAALWLQCWRKQPWGLTHVVSSSDRRPVSGTQDWTLLEMKVRVPAGTDFVTLRCVLKGSGTAWFDEISIAELDVKEKPKAHKRKPGRAVQKEDEPEATREPEPVETVATPKSTARYPGIPVAETRDTARDLLAAGAWMADLLETLQETNESLAEELTLLRGEVRVLHEEVAGLRADAETAEGLVGDGVAGVEAAEPEARRAPPLVPHGYDLEELP